VGATVGAALPVADSVGDASPPGVAVWQPAQIASAKNAAVTHTAVVERFIADPTEVVGRVVLK
jgi:hypothetical protein